MILTITYQGTQSTDLGYLLHKNPNRPQSFELSFGKAHVFYPEATDACCTMALLLDIDPIDLARGKKGSSGENRLFDYVNDRPYVASSFLSVAISRIFGTAMSGRCKDKPDLAEKALRLQTKIVMLPCRGNSGIIGRLFEPLGYQVSVEEYLSDEEFPEWGLSKYYTVQLTGEHRLQDLLNHLYVLIPVLDSDKHYWVGDDEIEKLIRHGEGWLASHPEKPAITTRYLKKKTSLVNKAFDRLLDEESENDDTEEKAPSENEKSEHMLNLNQQRLAAIISSLKSLEAKTVIDIGCGEGKLLALLIKEKEIQQVTGVDVSYSVLERAHDRLKLDHLPEKLQAKINLYQGSLTYRDKRFSGYDAATVIEVIEHLDPNRLQAFEKVLFHHARPKSVVLTTPNKEYNVHYNNLFPGEMRHTDHRFEWTREEFKTWAMQTADRYGYSVEFDQIGESDVNYGSPTQMAIFKLKETASQSKKTHTL